MNPRVPWPERGTRRSGDVKVRKRSGRHCEKREASPRGRAWQLALLSVIAMFYHFLDPTEAVIPSSGRRAQAGTRNGPVVSQRYVRLGGGVFKPTRSRAPARVSRMGMLLAEQERMQKMPRNSRFAQHRRAVVCKALELLEKEDRDEDESDELMRAFRSLNLDPAPQHSRSHCSDPFSSGTHGSNTSQLRQNDSDVMRISENSFVSQTVDRFSVTWR